MPRGGHYAYMFESKGIQRYIFHSGKLRDVVGASDLVAGLASSDPKNPGKIAKFSGSLTFSRRAGGTFCIHSTDRDELVRLRAQWRLYVMTNVPGLEFTDAIGEGDNEIAAMRACFPAMGGIRQNGLADAWPLGRPITRVAPLTGMPAITEGHDLLDIVAIQQRENRGDRLAPRFVEKLDPGQHFPRRLDDEDDDEGDGRQNPKFPFVGGDRRIALIHADLSGLGEMFCNMGNSFTMAVQNFELASSIEAAIERAVKIAGEVVVSSVSPDGTLPARPILLGGDDITLIVRADLAIAYTCALLAAIEVECTGIGLSEGQAGLSACAGVAIIGKGTPFLTAYGLAEKLCNHAKDDAKKNGPVRDSAGRPGYPSCFSFHVYQYGSIALDEDTASSARDCLGRPFSANPYYVGARMGPATAERLLELATALASMSAGHNRVRDIRSLLADDEALANAAWRRWWIWGKRRDKEGMNGLAQSLAIEEDAYAGDRVPPLPDRSSGLFDAMLLLDFGAVERTA